MEMLEDQEEKLLNSLMITFIAQMDSALKISKIISEHTDEKELSVDSIIIGLVYRLMVPMDDKEMKESMEFASNLINGEEEEEEEEEGEEEEEEEEEKVIFDRKVKTNHCNCDICTKARVCLINYPTYEANDPLADKFRNAIQTTCENHKIEI